MRGGGPGFRGLRERWWPVPPGARGWSLAQHGHRPQVFGSPGCAGVVPSIAATQPRRSRFPRVRGGGPLPDAELLTQLAVPPGARGWSQRLHSHPGPAAGSPGCAGVVPSYERPAHIQQWFPRVRGGGPGPRFAPDGTRAVPPGARGWSPNTSTSVITELGSPGCAGVVPRARSAGFRRPGFPRVRGGGPYDEAAGVSFVSVPPGARGWSQVQ